MKTALLNLWRLFNPKLPPLDVYVIPERPRRNVRVDNNRSTTARVTNGKAHVDTIEADGTIVTTIGKHRPQTPSDVVVDKFDMALLDFCVGLKWKKDTERAAIMKWHWLNGQSAAQIEVEHTDKQTRQLERGFSERTAADYIRAFYDADDEREKQRIPRLRPSRGTTVDETANVIEW